MRGGQTIHGVLGSRAKTLSHAAVMRQREQRRTSACSRSSPASVVPSSGPPENLKTTFRMIIYYTAGRLTKLMAR